jgi:tetratricopeptide (TPR) repeat protein
LVCLPAGATNQANVRAEQQIEGQKKPQGVEGVTVAFAPKSGGERIECTTDKKGRCHLPRVNTLQGADIESWTIRVETVEGLLPIETTVEIRTASASGTGKGTLTTDAPLVFAFDSGSRIANLKFTELGSVDVMIELGPADAVTAMMSERQAAAASETPQDAAQEAVAPKENFAASALELANQGQYEESLPKFEKGMEDRGDDPEFLLAYAKVCYTTGRYRQVEPLALRILELDATHLGALKMLGTKRAKQLEWDGATQALRRAYELSPGDGEIVGQLLFVADNSGEPRHAKDVCQTLDGSYEDLVLELTEPGDGELWLSVNRVCKSVGFKKLAAKALDRAEETERSAKGEQARAEVDPEQVRRYSIARYNQGAAIMRKADPGREDLEQATAAFQKALKNRPDYADACEQLASALVQLKYRHQTAPTREAVETLTTCARVVAATDPQLSDRVQRLVEALQPSP